jgi:DNA-binding NarL/FixJ family response regulator
LSRRGERVQTYRNRAKPSTEVSELFLAGKSVREISFQLRVSEETVQAMLAVELLLEPR